MPNNTIKLTSYVSNETLIYFVNMLRIGKTSYRNFEQDFKKYPFAIGRAVDYRMEEFFVASDGLDSTSTNQDVIQATRQLVIDKAKHVKFSFDMFNLTLDRQEDSPYMDKHLKPAARALAEIIETNLAQEMLNSSYYVVGTPGQAITNQNLINIARGKMVKHAIPDEGRRFVAMNVDDSVSMTNGMANYYNKPVNEAALTEGYLNHITGFDLFESVFTQRHISGTGDGTAAVNGLIAFGAINADVANGASSIVVKSLPNSTAGVALKGDVIQLVGINSVNPTTKIDTGEVFTATVTDTSVTTSGSGIATVNLSRPIYFSGNLQNATLQPQANGVLKLYASHNYSLAYNSRAIVFAAPKLKDLDGGVITSTAFSPEWVLSLQYLRYANGDKSEQANKLQTIWGQKANGEYIVRVMS